MLIECGLCKIRTVLKSDSVALLAMYEDIGLQDELMSYPLHRSGENTFDTWLEKRTRGTTGFFGVIENFDAQFVGFVQIADIHKAGGFGWLGIAIVSEFRGKKYAKTAIQHLVKYAKSALNLQKLLLSVSHENQRAVALYQNLGFRKVGFFERHYVTVKGSTVDVQLMEKWL